MKINIVAIAVFCALLATICGHAHGEHHEHDKVHGEHHEHGKVHGEHHSNRAHRAHDRLKSRHVQHSVRDQPEAQNQNQSQTDPICRCDNSNGSLLVNYNSSTNTLVVRNKTANTEIIIDFRSKLIALIDSNSKTVIIFNDNGSGVIIRNATDVSNLTALYEAGKQNSFNVSSVPSEVSKEAAPILGSLGYGNASLSDFANFIKLLAPTWEVLSRFSTDFSFEFSGDLPSLFKRFQGLGDIVRQFSSGRQNFTINFGDILSQPTGIASFSSLLQQLSSRVDVSQIFGRYFSSPDQFYSLIAQLGGNYPGFDEFLQIIRQLNNPSSYEDIVNSLVKFFGNPQINSSSVVQQWVSGIQNLTQNSNLTQSLPGLRQILNQIRNGGSVNGTNVTEILGHPDPRGASHNIIRLLAGSRFRLGGTISRFLARLVCLYSSPNGLEMLRRFIPNFNGANIIPSAIGGYFKTILGFFETYLRAGRDIAKLMSAFWRHIPFLRLFFVPMSDAMGYYSEIALERVLESKEAVDILQNWFSRWANSSSGGGTENLGNIFGGVDWAKLASEGFGEFVNAAQEGSFSGIIANTTGGGSGGNHSGSGPAELLSGLLPLSEKNARVHTERHHSKSHEKKHEVRS